MNNPIDWNELRLVLAVATTGTLSAAADRLGVSHATVFRQLSRLESRLGVRLFERSRTGYAATPAGQDVAAAARRIEREVLSVERCVAGRDLHPSGTVRVTTTDTLLFGVLSGIFAGFRRAHPQIELEVAVSNELFSLSRREADVAIRPAVAPPDALVGRKAGIVALAIYASKDLVGDGGWDMDVRAFDWIGPDDRMGYPALERWLRETGLDELCRYRFNTMLGMYLAAAEGAGLAVLPCYLGDGDTRLARIGERIDALAIDLWLLTHADLRRTARVRALLDFVAEALKRQRHRLAGTGS